MSSKEIRKQVKRITPDYFGWVLLFIMDIILSLFWCWLIWKGLIAERAYIFDLGGYSLAFAASVFLLWNIYELWILIKILTVEWGRVLIFDEQLKSLSIRKGTKAKELKLSDLREVIFTERRFGSRTLTAHLCYMELLFKDGEQFLITSFMANTDEMAEMIGRGNYKRITRSRRLFEGIRKNSLQLKPDR